MLTARTVIYYAAKHGNAEAEWEDGGAWNPGDPLGARPPRLAVTDGATQGFGSARWAQRLAAGFVGADPGVEPPALTAAGLLPWVEVMRQRWYHDPIMAGANALQRLKLEQVGSFATFLGCELRDLHGPRPSWTAVALGDTVLFHVRGERLEAQFPPIAADDFGYNPDGLPTRADGVAAMIDRLLAGSGELVDGDLLYVATDALAQWMVRTCQTDPAGLWRLLANLDHPAHFRALVADRRHVGELTNDDVTLLRARVTAAEPAFLVVCG